MLRASTVILLRRSDTALLMVERKSTNRAFAGAMVFPGGVQEAADSRGLLDAAKVCALRELFEETGVVLGKQPTSETRALQGPCATDASLFGRVYDESELKAATGRLKLWSVWVTPQQEKYRYHTTFYALPVSDAEASVAVHDNVEVVSSHFASAETFLERHDKQEMFLVPPTWVTLRELAALGTVEQIMASKRSANIIEPTLVRTPELLNVCLPGDMQHFRSRPNVTGLRRVVVVPGQPFRWVDTVANSTIPTSSL
jgi:8-oxo-dGTP pyrophosphatase MutT (NUDIX family)